MFKAVGNAPADILLKEVLSMMQNAHRDS